MIIYHVRCSSNILCSYKTEKEANARIAEENKRLKKCLSFHSRVSSLQTYIKTNQLNIVKNKFSVSRPILSILCGFIDIMDELDDIKVSHFEYAKRSGKVYRQINHKCYITSGELM